MKSFKLVLLFTCLCLLVAMALCRRTRAGRTKMTVRPDAITDHAASISPMRRRQTLFQPNTDSASKSSPFTNVVISESSTGDEILDRDFMRVGPLAKTRQPIRSKQFDGTSCGNCTLFSTGIVELDCYGLALSQEQFTDTYQQCAESLASVQVLYLGANSIGNIESPDLLLPFSALEELYLTDNDISNLDSNSFQNIPNLKVLDLRGNLLNALSADVFDKIPMAQVIRLGGNTLRNINAQLFASLPALTELDLSANGITDTTNLVFTANSQLEVLDLSANKLRKINADALALPSLKVVNLAYNLLTQAAVESINWYSEASLSVLDLTASGLTTIPRKLPASVDLLILSYNKITRLDQAQLQSTKDFGPFSLRLDNNNLATIPLETFQYVYNIIGLDISFNQLSSVPRVLPRNLIHLNISNNFINATTGQLTASARYLAYLNMSNNRVVALRTAALNSTQLFGIDLSSNVIGIIERQSIQNMPYLIRLQLRNNPVNRIDRDAFGDLPQLNELDLSSCTSSGVRLVNPVFGDLPNLRKLNVSNCPTLCNYTVAHYESLSRRDFNSNANTAKLSSVSRLDRISELDLSSCQFRKISATFLDVMWNQLTRCYSVSLLNNPWHCDVNFWATIQKMRQMYPKLYNFGDYVCASPPALRGKRLVWLTVNELLAANPGQARDAAALGLFPIEEYPPDCRCGDCNCQDDLCSCDPNVPQALFRSGDRLKVPVGKQPEDFPGEHLFARLKEKLRRQSQ